MTVLLTAIELLCGSLMFSYWLGLAAKKDLKSVGDGNPGAANLWQAAGYKLGILGVVLDFAKGYFPLVLLAGWGLVEGWALVPVAIAPIVGHAFSPFVKWKGGKGIAVSFGVWSAVTGFEASVAYAVILALILIAVKMMRKGKPVTPEIDGLMVVSGMFALGVYLALRRFAYPFLLLCLLNFLLFLFLNRAKLYTLFRLHWGKEKQEDTWTMKN